MPAFERCSPTSCRSIEVSRLARAVVYAVYDTIAIPSSVSRVKASSSLDWTLSERRAMGFGG